VKPALIDTAAALRILMSPNDKKADPHTQADFIERGSRSGHFHLWGFHGYAAEAEPISFQHACTLEFSWNARPSKVDDQLGQLELWGSRGEPVWRNVHFYEAEIEAAGWVFLALWLLLMRLAVPPSDARERKKVSAQIWLEYQVATDRCDVTGIVNVLVRSMELALDVGQNQSYRSLYPIPELHRYGLQL